MANPTRTETFTTFVSSVTDHRRPDLVDNFFTAAPLFLAMRKRNAVPLKGGKQILASHIYGGVAASSYGRGDEFSTATADFATTLVFDWAFSYAPVNLDVIDADLNDAPEQVFDLVDSTVEVAELSLINDMSNQLYADGTGNSGKDFEGLAIAVSRTGSYGGLTRGTDSQGSSIRAAFEDTSGGTLTLSTMNSNYGTAIIAKKSPDLLITTQNLWNRIYDRVQPADRNQPGDSRVVGFRSFTFNGADVVADPHCPAGFLYMLNTEFFEFITHKKWNFAFRGFMEPSNQQRMIGQIVWWGNLVCRGPRFQGVMSGLSET